MHHDRKCYLAFYLIIRNFLDELKTKNNLPGKILKIEKITKIDLLQDKKIELWKVIADNPLVIGGIDNSLRNLIKTWEADIKYYENYMYDNVMYMIVQSPGKYFSKPRLFTASILEDFNIVDLH